MLQDTKNKIVTEISNSWSNYQSLKSVLEATKAQLRAAEIANEGITLEYDSGNSRTTFRGYTIQKFATRCKNSLCQIRERFYGIPV